MRYPKFPFLLPALLTLGCANGVCAQSYWTWPLTADPYADSALLDLRHLNENLAGDLGWVFRDGEKLYYGDGTEARFWATNLRDWGGFTEAQLRDTAKLSAKRGVNMVRTLARVYNQGTPLPSAIRTQAITHTQRSVRAFKESGIYSSLSLFLPLLID